MRSPARGARWISPLAVPAALYALVLLVIFLSLTAPRFLTMGNLANLGRTSAILALAACGQAIVVITGGLDLSSGSSVALVSVVSVLAALRASVPLALAAGALLALGVGVLNGLLIAQFEIPPFLVTLGTLTAGHGLASLLIGGVPLEAPPSAHFSWLGRGSLGSVPVPILLAALGFAVLGMLLRWTVLGRSWYLIGANIRGAGLAGVRVGRSLFGAYVVSGAFVAVAGLVLTSRVNSGQPNLFPTLPFEAIAACAIGGIPLSGGVGGAVQVLLGVLILAAVENGLRLLNFSSDVQLMFIGGLTVGAILLQRASGGVLGSAAMFRFTRSSAASGDGPSIAEERR